MDFLSSFKEAMKQGITKEEFLKIWRQEMEMKMAVAHSTTRAEGPTYFDRKFNETLQTRGVQPSKMDLSEIIYQLSRELKEQSQLQHQEIIIRLENIESKLSILLQEREESHDKTFDDPYESVNASASSAFNSELLFLPMGGYSNQEAIAPTKSTTSTLSESSSQSCIYGAYLKEDGAVLRIKTVDKLVQKGNKVSSPILISHDCPCKVQLKVWFMPNGEMKSQLSIFGLYNESLKACRKFKYFGFALNVNSGAYSPLFEGNSSPLRHLRPEKEFTAYPAVFCLKTLSGSFENVTFKELEKRHFVHEMNTVIVKWKVITEEVDTSSTSTSKANSLAGSKVDLFNV